MPPESPRYEDFAKAYREARLASGLSQERLANAAGATRQQIIRIEQGRHRPTAALRARIAAALEVDPETLPVYGGAGSAPPFPQSASAT